MATALSMHEMALESVPVSLVITNPNIEDNPIVFVNAAFTRLTGYAPEVSVGRNCRFLQGADTEKDSLDRMREAIRKRSEVTVELTNYKADGSPFRNEIHLSPLLSEDGVLQYFIALQRPVVAKVGHGEAAGTLLGNGEDKALREIHHRVKNHLSMVVGMIRMQSRAQNANSLENYATLARRIETLQLLYQEMTTGGTQAASEDDIALGAYVSRIASAIAFLDGRESVRLNLELGNVRAPMDAAAQIGLLVSELLTNAYQHAFDDGCDGLVEVRLTELSNGGTRLQVSDDGRGLPEGSTWPKNGNLGSKIVSSLLTGLRAQLGVSSGSGTVITIDVPPSQFEHDVARPPQRESATAEPVGHASAM